jgi:hypothetical protein
MELSHGREEALRGESEWPGTQLLNSTENAGFVVYNFPAKEKLITDEQALQEGHYQEVGQLLIGLKEVCTKICALSESCH